MLNERVFVGNGLQRVGAQRQAQRRGGRRHQGQQRLRQPLRVARLLVVAAFIAMALGPNQLWLIALGAVVFDLGAQATLIAHQTLIYGIEPAARTWPALAA